MGNNIKDLDALHQVMKGEITLDKACEGMTDDFEIGHVSHRADGDWRKVAQGKWVPVKAAGGGQQGEKPEQTYNGYKYKGKNIIKTRAHGYPAYRIEGEKETSYRLKDVLAKIDNAGQGQMGAGEKASEKPAEAPTPKMSRAEIREKAEDTVIKKYDTEFKDAKKKWMNADKKAMADSYARAHFGPVYSKDWYKEYSKSDLASLMARDEVIEKHYSEVHGLVQNGGQEQKPAEQQGSFYEGDDDGFLEPNITEPEPDDEPPYEYDNPAPKMTPDAAPRLTRDTKIRLSRIKREQTQDKTYNVGETSQRKDGLYKKIAPGKWAPVKGGGSAGAPAGGNSRTDGGLVWRSPDDKHRIHEDNSSGKTKYTLYELGDDYSRVIGEYDSPEAAVAAGEKINAPAGGKAEVNPITGKPMRPETVAYAQQKKAEAEQKRNTEKTAGGFTLAQNDKIKNAALDVITKRRGERLTAKNLKRDYKMSDEEANETVRRVNEYFENLQKDRKEFAKAGGKANGGGGAAKTTDPKKDAALAKWATKSGVKPEDVSYDHIRYSTNGYYRDSKGNKWTQRVKEGRNGMMGPSYEMFKNGDKYAVSSQDLGVILTFNSREDADEFFNEHTRVPSAGEWMRTGQ